MNTGSVVLLTQKEFDSLVHVGELEADSKYLLKRDTKFTNKNMLFKITLK